MRKCGWTNNDLKRLENPHFLTEVLWVVRGQAEVKLLCVDLDADPFIPEGWVVKQHRQSGKFQFDPEMVTYLTVYQREIAEHPLAITDFPTLLADKPWLNANLLDWLLLKENQHLIPEDWKELTLGFVGTTYSNSDEPEYSDVRCLEWNAWDNEWGWTWSCEGTQGLTPAGLLANLPAP